MRLTDRLEMGGPRDALLRVDNLLDWFIGLRKTVCFYDVSVYYNLVRIKFGDSRMGGLQCM